MNYLSQETTISMADAKLFATVLLCYATYRFILTRYIFSPLGQLLKIDPKRNYKFSHRCFDTLHYTISALLGVLAMSTRTYFRSLFWAKGLNLIEENPDAFHVSVAEKIYVILFLCYYIVDVFYIGAATGPLLIGIHHVATLSLICGSIYLRQGPVCVAIMVLHDVVDVPLYIGKMGTYLGFKKVKEVGLLTFGVLCTWFRIINYPIIAYQSSKYVKYVQFKPEIFKFDSMFLWLLYFCHLCWFYDILCGVKEIFDGKPNAIRDNRSD